MLAEEEIQRLFNGINKDDFWKPYKEVIRIYKLYQQSCQSSDFKSYQGKGIVPECFWNTTENIPFKILAYESGIIDGLYQEVEGLTSMLTNIDEFLYAFTLAYLTCKESRVAMKVNFFKDIDFTGNDPVGSIVERLNNAISFEKVSIERSEEAQLQCDQAKIIREQTEEAIIILAELLDRTPPFPNQTQHEIYNLLEEHVEKIGANNNLSYYLIGKNVAFIGTFFIPSAQITKIAKLKTLKSLEKLKKITPKQWDEIVGAVGDGTQNLGKLAQRLKDFPKLANKLEDLNDVPRSRTNPFVW